MDIKNGVTENENEEEDDFGSYFLQPASSPYNIAEKVLQANTDLFNNTVNNNKTVKVKFKEDLITYEPELTDDDVNSIESDCVDLEINNAQILEFKTSNEANLDIFDINEEVEEEEIVEEIQTEFKEHNNEIGTNNCKAGPKDVKEVCVADALKENEYVVKINDNKNILSCDKHKKRSRHKSALNIAEVKCRSHCIDKLTDFDLSMSIKKLEIREKPPPNCPPLKLLQRKCCDEVKIKNKIHLPSYNGMRSEYGLSLYQLQMRQRKQEIIKLKEQKRQQLLQEFRERRIQQNEAVFCQWLNDVAKRNAERQKSKKLNDVSKKQGFSPNVVSLPNNPHEKVRERPKTANDFVPKQNIKRRRPHTTQSCVYIEVTPNMLQRGINIGDLMIRNADLTTKKLHVLTVS